MMQHLTRGAEFASARPLLEPDDGIELSHLWRFLFVAALITSCLLLAAWSRVDLIEISVALDQVEASLASAKSERSRLELELATLNDPHHLARSAERLSLQVAVPVVEIRPQ